MNRLVIATVAVLAIAVTGCKSATLNFPEETSVRRPRANPTPNKTTFTDAFHCMDKLLASRLDYQLIVAVENIHDKTNNKIADGAKDMLITAITDISATYGRIIYSAAGGDLDKLYDLRKNNVDKYDAKSKVFPGFAIAGSITEADRNLASGGDSANLGIPGIASVGVENKKSMSSIALDMRLVNITTDTAIPGVNSRNELAVFRHGTEAGVGGALLKKVELDISSEFETNESFTAAVRKLLELGLIEIIGKYTRTPYENCLMGQDTRSAFMESLTILPLRGSGDTAREGSLEKPAGSSPFNAPRPPAEAQGSAKPNSPIASRAEIESVKARVAAESRDRASWEMAVRVGTASSYDAYLSEFPYGEFAELARKKQAQTRDAGRSRLHATASEPEAKPSRREGLAVQRPESAVSDEAFRSFRVIRPVAVRDSPRSGGRAVGNLTSGDTIRAVVVPLEEGWQKITLENGNTGYVFGDPFHLNR